MKSKSLARKLRPECGEEESCLQCTGAADRDTVFRSPDGEAGQFFSGDDSNAFFGDTLSAANGQLLPTANLDVSQPGDALEKEAERIADQFVNGNELDGSPSNRGSLFTESMRGYFQTGVGADLTKPRIHTDSRAAATAKRLNAKAFTVGKDIYFGENTYHPESREGRKLLAHELVHVAQQKRAVQVMRQQAGQAQPPKEASDPTDRMIERAARRIFNEISGFAPDVDVIYASLVGLTNDEIERVSLAYWDLAHRSLVDDVRNSLRGDDQADILYLLQHGTPAVDPNKMEFQDCSGFFMPGQGAMSVIYYFRTVVLQGAEGRLEDALAVLSRGWRAMSVDQKLTFMRFFDPGGTLNLADEALIDGVVLQVRDNFSRTLREMVRGITIECDSERPMCKGNRLYFTYLSNIHVCPTAYQTQVNQQRLQRDFLHEIMHNTMLVADQAYWNEQKGIFYGPYSFSSPDEEREIKPGGRFRRDSLLNPDSYSWFAFSI